MVQKEPQWPIPGIGDTYNATAQVCVNFSLLLFWATR